MAIRNRISFHGPSLNIDPDLSYFSLNNPCGLEGIRTTSLAREILGIQPTLPEVREQARSVIRQVFKEIS